jgi:hypothetical protein
MDTMTNRIEVGGRRQITYDARGLSEPVAEIPMISEIDGL